MVEVASDVVDGGVIGFEGLGGVVGVRMHIDNTEGTVGGIELGAVNASLLDNGMVDLRIESGVVGGKIMFGDANRVSN